MPDNKEKKQNKTEGELVKEWWISLKDNKGGRAELRRAKNIDEVFFSPVFHSLYRKLVQTDWHTKERIALIAGVLSHVETHAGAKSFAALMASPGKSGEKARVSGLRFRRLLQNKTLEDLYGPMIRIINLLDKKANVPDLAQKLYWWNDRTRKDWAFAYYSQSPGEE